MEYEIVREPYLFMETMEMLHKYVNHTDFASLWTPRRELSGTEAERLVLQRLELLQGIMERACRDVDVTDPALTAFFENINIEQFNEPVFLGKFMVSAFMSYHNTGFEETVADLRSEWERMQERGYWLRCCGSAGLQYTDAEGSPGNLFEQICVMDLPAEFRLQLYGVLHRFPEALEELAGLMRPVAASLQEVLRKSPLEVGTMAEYWLAAQRQPLEFMEDAFGAEAVAGVGDRLRLGISLMDANRITYGMAHEPGRTRDFSYAYIGCCISVASLRKEHYTALDEVSSTLRGLSERKRLEALRQLAKKRLYGVELAEILNMDRGNLSRLLGVLHEQGFLRQEKENLRTYYRADRVALQEFFNRVMSLIFD
ncbi:MAG: winged helix-turn-helix transcriptional regulator [Oscillospiraceae bacterium]|nr:winged helix-turn-helix transcriptional regulator [Oscillospiraceae bacterium]